MGGRYPEEEDLAQHVAVPRVGRFDDATCRIRYAQVSHRQWDFVWRKAALLVLPGHALENSPVIGTAICLDHTGNAQLPRESRPDEMKATQCRVQRRLVCL